MFGLFTTSNVKSFKFTVIRSGFQKYFKDGVLSSTGTTYYPLLDISGTSV